MLTSLKRKLNSTDNPVLDSSEQCSAFSPEFELLLSCLQMHFYPDSGRQPLCPPGIDWHQLLYLASHHGVLPLLHQSLEKLNSEAIPPDVSQRLQQYCRVNAMRNLGLTQELLRLLAVFEAHQIRVIPYKGPTLAMMAYGDLFQRQFCDLDFLMAPEDWLRMQRVLAAEGYGLRWGEAMSPAQQALYFQSSCEYTYLSADGNFAVEPHWNILPRRFWIPLDFQALGQAPTSVRLLGQPVATFSPETTLLILCLNGTKDRWRKLKLIGDVAGILQTHPALDWDDLLETVTRSGCQRIFFLGLLLAKRLLAAPLPDLIEQAVLADPVVHSLAAEVMAGFKDPTRVASKPVGGSNFSRWELKIRERWLDKAGYCWNLLVTPNEGDAAWLELPPSLYPLYSLLRPLRLLGRGARGRWRVNGHECENVSESTTDYSVE